MTDYFQLNLSREELLAMSSLGLAHLGDSVYEVMVRSWLCTTGKVKPKELHRATVKYVAAPAQAAMSQKILPILFPAILCTLLTPSPTVILNTVFKGPHCVCVHLLSSQEDISAE